MNSEEPASRRFWGTMKAQSILIVMGLLLVVFGLGLWLGARLNREHSGVGDGPPPVSSVQLSVPPTSAIATPCVDVRNAESQVGKGGCVTGLVLKVYPSRAGNVYLDFCQDYRTCPFSSIIFAPDKVKFGDLGSLQGKRVEIRGDIINYQGRAEIVIRDPQQVRAAP